MAGASGFRFSFTVTQLRRTRVSNTQYFLGKKTQKNKETKKIESKMKHCKIHIFPFERALNEELLEIIR